MALRGSYVKTTVEIRQRIIDAADNGDDFVQLAQMLNIPKSTAYSIVNRGRSDYSAMKGGKRHNKWDDDMEAFAEEVLSREPSITVNALNSRMRAHFGDGKQPISNSCLSKHLDGMLFTVKKCYNFPTGRNSERVKDLRRDYAEWFGAIRGAGQELVYTDETNFGVWTQRSNGRSKKGTKCHRLVSNSHGKNLNIIMSVSAERGLVYWERHYGSVTCERFEQYLLNLSDHLQNNSIIVIDNAPCHNRACDVAGVTVKKLPPYSPMLNAIEEAFSCMKYAIKAKMSELREEVYSTEIPRSQGLTIVLHRRILMERIADEVINQTLISQRKVFQWDQHVLKFMQLCFDRADIIE